MKFHSLLLGVFAVLCSFYSVLTNSYPPEFVRQVQEYPNIITESRSKCRPTKGVYNNDENYVCDPDGLLTISEINSLNSRIYDIRNNINKDSAGNCNPNKPRPSIAIALVSDMKIKAKDNEEILNYSSVFAYYLFDEWKLSTNCVSGYDKLIIFYSKKDGALYTYAGSPLSQRLQSKNIIRLSVLSKPLFNFNVASGLNYLLEKYKNIFMGIDKGMM